MSAIPPLKAAMARAAEVRPKVGGFPYLAEALRQAGVTRCAMTVPSNAMLYLTDAGPVAVQGEPLLTGMSDVPPFDRAALVAALRADRRARPPSRSSSGAAGRRAWSGTTWTWPPGPVPTTARARRAT